ncbi:MAG: bifunctional YncE family protein/alkaline phosphatase family protein [Bacteroidetes bacterium]|nr:bifunctional YncE family protein/alkaline phosphatase family protein [Bacteroidota bacterium]
MKKALIGIFALASIAANAQPRRPAAPGIIDLPTLEARRVNLPNGWSLTPVGTSLPLGDLPLNIAVSRTGKYAAITNNGQSVQSIQLIDPRSGRQLDSVEIGVAWGGIAFTADERSLYVSGGNDNWIIGYSIRNNMLVNDDTIRLGERTTGRVSPAGIAIDDVRHLLYVVTKENNSLYVIDLRSHSVARQLPLSSEGYTCVLSPDKKELYISEWGSKQIAVYNASSNSITDSIAVGDHPNDLCLSGNGQYLYVANALDNSVSVVDTKARKVLETLNAALYPESRVGSTTNGVALSADEKTLYVADADNNCLAVFDVRKPGAASSLGFIPTGWYPTCVRVVGRRLLVANGKGFSSFPNPHGPNPVDVRQRVFLHQGDSVRKKKIREQYIGGGLLMGSLSMIPAPSDEQLKVYTQAVYKNTPYKKETELMYAGVEAGNPVPGKVGDVSPIKHVFYIIKENRTYDQVLGDVPEGNGDTSLVLFGERITPNQHALAKEFVLLDNFYVDGEVSADGHQWSMGAYATDYMEKIWPSAYGHRGGNYNTPTVLDRSYIWDQCAKAGVSYRTYGEFVNKDKNGHDKPAIPVLEGHFCPYFRNMDQHIFDTARAYKWMQEFDSLVALHAVPAFQVVRFGNDHTEGTTPGRPTPFAHVADNDLAVGLFVEHLSKSPIWKESVVFVLEDDAQNGPDHVDAHRSPVYMAGGFVKRHFVDHTMYTTSSVLHTMELILGLQPMTQYDAAAVPMWRCFDRETDGSGFVSLPERVDLRDVNPARGKLAAMAKGLDFTHEDAQPDAVMNAMLWKAAKGEDAVVPAPVRAAFVKTTSLKTGDGDDD